MRQKAEREIRRAAHETGSGPRYRIDRVRKRTSLHRKVFDKTILDMARVGTIALSGGNGEELAESEKRDLIQKGDTIHVYFTFLDSKNPIDWPAEKNVETIDIKIKGIEKGVWDHFEYICRTSGKKSPNQMIIQLITSFIQQIKIEKASKYDTADTN